MARTRYRNTVNEEGLVITGPSDGQGVPRRIKLLDSRHDREKRLRILRSIAIIATKLQNTHMSHSGLKVAGFARITLIPKTDLKRREGINRSYGHSISLNGIRHFIGRKVVR